jgi:hypothetical protein
VLSAPLPDRRRPAAWPRASIKPGELYMNKTLSIGPLVALIAGILILIMPRLLNYIIALYLIIIGILGIIGPARAALM